MDSMGWFIIRYPANDLSRTAWRRNPCKNCKCESPTWRSTRHFHKSCPEKNPDGQNSWEQIVFLPDPKPKEQVTDLFAALNSRHTKVGSSVGKDTDGVLSDVQTS